MSSKIKEIKAFEIFNSRGDATVKIQVILDNGIVGYGTAPSGASKGKHEAYELTDTKNNIKLNSTEKSIALILPILNKEFIGIDVLRHFLIDAMLARLGGENLKKTGSNFTIAFTWATLRAAACYLKLPLFQYLKSQFLFKTKAFPKPMMNVINGGVHSDSGLTIQEFMIVPCAESFTENIKEGVRFYKALGRELKKRGLTTAVGDEGGYAAKIGKTEEVLELLLNVKDKINSKVSFALDAAANSFSYLQDGKYLYKIDNKILNGNELSDFWLNLTTKYSILSIEDPFNEEDLESWRKLHKSLIKNNNKSMLIGDDLFVTNIERLRTFHGLCDGIILKPNQVGLMESFFDTVKLARDISYKLIVSHRSGDTCDSFIADLAYGIGADYIKSGAPARGERIEKYNRLIEIENNSELI